jgi:hypothetical protein
MLRLLAKAVTPVARASSRHAVHSAPCHKVGARAFGALASCVKREGRMAVPQLPHTAATTMTSTMARSARALHAGGDARSSKGGGGADGPIELDFDDHLEIVSQHLELLQRNNKFGKALAQIKVGVGSTQVQVSVCVWVCVCVCVWVGGWV